VSWAGGAGGERGDATRVPSQLLTRAVRDTGRFEVSMPPSCAPSPYNNLQSLTARSRARKRERRRTWLLVRILARNTVGPTPLHKAFIPAVPPPPERYTPMKAARVFGLLRGHVRVSSGRG
jgi:hypothetical protein